MVVNKEGDLELYAIYDTTKQVAWSSRGDLAIGAGVGLRVVEGYGKEDLNINPTEGKLIDDEDEDEYARSRMRTRSRDKRVRSGSRYLSRSASRRGRESREPSKHREHHQHHHGHHKHTNSGSKSLSRSRHPTQSRSRNQQPNAVDDGAEDMLAVGKFDIPTPNNSSNLTTPTPTPNLSGGPSFITNITTTTSNAPAPALGASTNVPANSISLTSPPPLFGRGDADGFPALPPSPAVGPTNPTKPSLTLAAKRKSVSASNGVLFPIVNINPTVQTEISDAVADLAGLVEEFSSAPNTGASSNTILDVGQAKTMKGQARPVSKAATVGPTGLAATRPVDESIESLGELGGAKTPRAKVLGRQRTYSPASIRKYRESSRDPSVTRGQKQGQRSPSRTDTLRVKDFAGDDQPDEGLVEPERDDADYDTKNGAYARRTYGQIDDGYGYAFGRGNLQKRGRGRSRGKSKDRKNTRGKSTKDKDEYDSSIKLQNVVRLVQEDVSMIMRRRAKAGYGLSLVSLF